MKRQRRQGSRHPKTRCARQKCDVVHLVGRLRQVNVLILRQVQRPNGDGRRLHCLATKHPNWTSTSTTHVDRKGKESLLLNVKCNLSITRPHQTLQGRWRMEWRYTAVLSFLTQHTLQTSRSLRLPPFLESSASFERLKLQNPWRLRKGALSIIQVPAPLPPTRLPRSGGKATTNYPRVGRRAISTVRFQAIRYCRFNAVI